MLPQFCFSDKPMKWKSIASEMVFLLKYRKMPKFRGAYLFWRGLYSEGLMNGGKLALKIDWASYRFSLFYFVFEGDF